MGVKVKLADTREVGDRKYKAGDVVDVAPGDARLLVALGAGVKVEDSTATASGETVPEAIPGNADIPKDEPAAGDVPTAAGATDAPAATTKPDARRKG
ncbi:hypothetical protein [Brachybacterium sp.]|uniref:hypothetical protein n=1 Tax=Brachybacterium sp. TaxID=1891286 RepID=UPI002ED19AED